MASNDMGAAVLTTKHEEQVRPWLDLVDTLRAQGVHEDLPLPQIAVMGDQSSGKSSVLEALSGVPFPRGTGLVTRCPTQLMMKRTGPGTTWRARATIASRIRPGVKPDAEDVSSPEELTAVIERLSQVVTELSSTGLSQEAIVIHVLSPDVPDLTLIDLPGIVRTATSGQDAKIIEEVGDMMDTYMDSERTIILAVIPANQDVATVDILERAAEVDPDGDRTIGVLTKPDLVGAGAENEVVDVVMNRRKPLKLGYIMMRNRTQAEIKNNTSLAESRMVEEEFFHKHPVYSSVPPNLVGAASLTGRLTELLVRRIKSVLPVMKFELAEKQRETNADMKSLGREAPADKGPRIQYLMKLVAEYCTLLRSAVRGDYRDDILSLEPRLRLRTVADSSFRILTDKIKSTEPNFDSPSFHASLEGEIRSLRGRELPGLVNSYFFYSFMVSKIEDWHAPVLTAKHELFDTTIAIGNSLFTKLCPQYPNLAQLVNDILEQWVEEHVATVDTRIDEAFKQEEDPFVSTDELANEIVKVRVERFDRALGHIMKLVGADKAVGAAESAADKMGPLEGIINDKLGHWYMANHGVSAAALIEDMRTVLTAYWRLSSKRLTENICMSFEAHVLQKLSEEIESELLTAVQLRPDVSDLFSEPPHIVADREQLKRRKQRFDAAQSTIERLAPDVVAVSRRAADAEGNRPGEKARVAIAAKQQRKMLRRNPELAMQMQQAQMASMQQGARRGGPADAAAGGGGGGGGAIPPNVDDGSIAVFEFTGKNGDNNGYIYWLGTEGKSKKFENPHTAGRLRITSSGMERGQEQAVVSRKRGEVVVKAGPDVFLCMDMGKSRAMSPTHYTLCHGSASAGYDLVNCFTLEGHSKARNQWVDLAVPPHAGPPRTLKSPHGVGTWPVDAQGERFRYLRVRSIGVNQKGDNSLPICAFEFYGRLYRV